MKGVTLRKGLHDCVICVPGEWTDEEAKAFADDDSPYGTEEGWQVRGDGRVTCATRRGFVHIQLEA